MVGVEAVRIERIVKPPQAAPELAGSTALSTKEPPKEGKPIPGTAKQRIVAQDTPHADRQNTFLKDSLPPPSHAAEQEAISNTSRNEATSSPSTHGLLNDHSVPFKSLPQDLMSRLRPHQIEGVRFMYDCVSGQQSEARGCILADDMGLGKTLQALSLIYLLLSTPRCVQIPALRLTRAGRAESRCAKGDRREGCHCLPSDFASGRSFFELELSKRAHIVSELASGNSKMARQGRSSRVCGGRQERHTHFSDVTVFSNPNHWLRQGAYGFAHPSVFLLTRH